MNGKVELELKDFLELKRKADAHDKDESTIKNNLCLKRIDSAIDRVRVDWDYMSEKIPKHEVMEFTEEIKSDLMRIKQTLT